MTTYRLLNQCALALLLGLLIAWLVGCATQTTVYTGECEQPQTKEIEK